MLLELDGASAAAATAAGAGATDEAVWGSAAVQPSQEGEKDLRPKFNQPLTIAGGGGRGGGGGGGIDSSCSTLLASPPPPMRVLSSGGQSSAYAALKAMNADDDLKAGGLSGAHLIRTDKKGLEAVGSSSKYFTLFPAAAPTASQGFSSLPPQSTVERNPAAAEGPPSLDSKVGTTQGGPIRGQN